MKKKYPLLGIVLSAGLILAACGDDDTSNGSDDTGSEGAGSDLNLLNEASLQRLQADFINLLTMKKVEN